MRKVALLSALLAISGLAPPRGFVEAAPTAQQPAARFRSGIDVVEVAVLAKDREGKPINDLTSPLIVSVASGFSRKAA